MSRKTEKKTHFTGKKVVLVGPIVSDKGETWHISVDGQRRSVSTSYASSAVMNEAMTLYSSALKRLADR